MGKASECHSIIRWVGPALETFHVPEKPILQWNGVLSIPQQNASTQLVQAISGKSSILVHAVCGAGKTEILFAAVESALAQGGCVCLATPRRDVVQELAPRFQRAFPTTIIEALYGGSELRDDRAQLTIATTHQLYRFCEAFDVMIIDEVDAFPYTMDTSLQKASQHAKKKESTLIYLTATPTKSLLKLVKKGELNVITIPARYHGYPLPEPVTAWIGNWKKSIERKKLTYSFQKWLEVRIQSGKQVLVFLPEIETMHKLEEVLSSFTNSIASVHANDPDRSAKVDKMRSGETKILLTTTILERGVTFSNIDVAVLGAEETIFTESALVQIAGRAGRNQHFPTGNVTFFHYGHTEAIIQAQQHIRKMNREASKTGLLKKLVQT